MGLVRDFSRNTQYFLASNVMLEGKSISRLLAKHGELWQGRIVPDSTKDVDRMQKLFQEVFKNFKAKN